MRLSGKVPMPQEKRGLGWCESHEATRRKLRPDSIPQEMAVRQAPLKAARVINRSGTVVNYRLRCIMQPEAFFYDIYRR